MVKLIKKKSISQCHKGHHLKKWNYMNFLNNVISLVNLYKSIKIELSKNQ